tara:strand:- start:1126 stop:1746 length:621 start_codon:yes stop_codon:yes gene_type:complete
MKRLLFILLLVPVFSFSQSKKELISTIERMKNDSTYSNLEIVELKNKISQKEKHIKKLSLKISQKEKQIKAFLQKLDTINPKINFLELENKLIKDTIQNLKNVLNFDTEIYYKTDDDKVKKLWVFIGAFDYYGEGDLVHSFFKNKNTGQVLDINCGIPDCYSCTTGELYLVIYYKDDLALWWPESDDTVPVSCAVKIIKLEKLIYN